MNILLTGFYGEGNLGDEAILSAILDNLPDTARPIITAGRLRPSIDRVKYIQRRKGLALPLYIKSAAKCKNAIFSGGILQDWSFDGVWFFAQRIITAAAMGSEPSLWGAGIGPLRHSWSRALAAQALKHVKVAWLRDEASVQLFKELTGREAQLGTDWSWHYKVPKADRPNSEGYLVNLRPWNHEIPQLEALKAQKQTLNNGNILGLAARGEDKKAIEALFGPVDMKEPNSFEELLSLCVNAEKGVAMRYHVALAMLRAGLSFTLIPYDHKVSQLEGALKNPDKFIKENEARYKSMQQAFTRQKY
jgi:polysaccharide pyruvyl transferase WcaK-like protein